MGRMLADPFPAEATEELRFYLGAVTKQTRVTLPEGTKLQPHPVVGPLLGSALKGLGDPGWRIRAQYAVGMPLGLGVELLRGWLAQLQARSWLLEGSGGGVRQAGSG